MIENLFFKVRVFQLGISNLNFDKLLPFYDYVHAAFCTNQVLPSASLRGERGS